MFSFSVPNKTAPKNGGMVRDFERIAELSWA
jgi:hypothetical protein